MRLTIRHRAAENERIAYDAFERSIGKRVPMDIDGRPIGVGELIAVEVSADGTEAYLTVEIESESLPLERDEYPQSRGPAGRWRT